MAYLGDWMSSLFRDDLTQIKTYANMKIKYRL